jgi:Carboxypeptidase regulatory-like domain/TonB dependent receptor
MVGSSVLTWKSVSTAVLIFVFALCISTSPALAQSASTGALSGTVTDPSGGVIAGATVTATNLATGQARTAVTDANGVYTISLLPPGNYSAKFSANGFKTAEVPSVTVNVTESRLLDRALEVGATTQSVTISETAAAVQTENATVGGLVSGDTVTELPLSTRNYTQVIDLSPGVVANVATATAVGNGTMDINVNGSGSDQNTYMMDGVVTTNYGSGGAAQSGSYAGIPIPNPDSIQEFKVQTSQYDAAYGQNPGANVNVVTKGGTNNFHGAVWEFNRNNFFNANDFFFKRGEINQGLPNKPPEVKQNQYGGTFGGPIKKDKIFFFGSYQGTRQLNGIGSNGFATSLTQVGLLPLNEPGVPFAQARSDGNAGSIPLGYVGPGMCSYDTYREYLGCAFAGQTDLFGGTGQAVLANGSNISNTAINLLRQTEKIPQAQGGFNNGFYLPSLRYNSSNMPFCTVNNTCSNLTTISQATIANEDQYMINSDYVLNSKNTLSEKYFFSKDPQVQSFSCIVTGCDPGSPEDAKYGSQSAVVRLTTVVTNNFVNDAFVSAQRLFLNVTDGNTIQSCAGDGTTALGITPAINDGTPCPLSAAAAGNREDSLIPVIGSLGFPTNLGGSNLINWPGWTEGGNFFSATHSLQQSYLTGDQISWNHGKHSFRAGVNTQRIQWNWAQPNRERGWVVAGSLSDILTSNSGLPSDEASGIAGAPVPINYIINLSYRLIPNGSPNPHHWRISEYSTFAQDDIKLTRHLTVNLGLRWEYDGWPSDAHGVFTNFSAADAGLVDTGTELLNNSVGTLAGYLVQKNYNRALYGNLTGEFGSTGIVVNSNKTLLNGSPLDNFSPRIGVAWQARDKLVIRAGYGMFFDRVYGNLVGDNILGNMPPYATGIGTQPGQTLQSPFCPECPQFLGFIPRTLSSELAPQLTNANPAFGLSNITDGFGGNASGLLNSGDDPAMRTPKIQQYNLDVQYEFSHGWILDVGYVGSHGIHLYDWNRDPNLAYLVDCGPASATCNPPTDLVNQLLERPAGTFPINDNGTNRVLENTSGNYLGRVQYLGVNPGNLQQVETDGNHLYNSLQVQLKHNFSHGLTLQASYTWSKLITDINASQAGAGIATPGNVLSGSASSNDPLNRAQQYGLAAFNRPQRFVLSYSYQIPYKADGWKEKAFGGWGISGVTTVQDGLPFSVSNGDSGNEATLLYGGSLPATGPVDRAELADPVKCSSQGVCQSGMALKATGNMLKLVEAGQSVLNINAFVPAPQFGGSPSTAGGPFTGTCTGANPEFVGCGTGFGNSIVGITSCCTQLNFDAAIIKNTPIRWPREDGNLQFRTEFFNLWNHAQFNEPGNSWSPGSTTYGVITSSAVPGRIMQFGLKYSF